MKVNAEDYVNLGYHVAHVFLKRNPHLYNLREDIEQEALLAVCVAAEEFELEGSTVAFSTYCTHKINQSILNFLRDKENKYNAVVGCSLEILTPETDEIDGLSWEDLVPGEVVDIQQHIQLLPDDCRKFCSLVIEGKTRHEIRQTLGISWKEFGVLKRKTKDALVSRFNSSIDL